jgi:hypothetical protein
MASQNRQSVVSAPPPPGHPDSIWAGPCWTGETWVYWEFAPNRDVHVYRWTLWLDEKAWHSLAAELRSMSSTIPVPVRREDGWVKADTGYGDERDMVRLAAQVRSERDTLAHAMSQAVELLDEHMGDSDFIEDVDEDEMPGDLRACRVLAAALRASKNGEKRT